MSLLELLRKHEPSAAAGEATQNAIGYLRVSTAEQADDSHNSLPVQRQHIEKWAAENNVRVMV